MQTRRIFLRSEALGRGYAPALCNGTRAIRNTACYLILNVQSALAKGEGFQTSCERCALLKAGIAIRQENAEKERRFALKVKKCSDALRGGKVRALEAHSMVRDALLKASPLPLPDREHSILTYAQLDAVMKVTGDPSYALPSSKPCGIFGKKLCIGPPLPGAYVKAELKPTFGGYFSAQNSRLGTRRPEAHERARRTQECVQKGRTAGAEETRKGSRDDDGVLGWKDAPGMRRAADAEGHHQHGVEVQQQEASGWMAHADRPAARGDAPCRGPEDQSAPARLRLDAGDE